MIPKDRLQFLLPKHAITLKQQSSLGNFKLSLRVESLLLLHSLCFFEPDLVLLLDLFYFLGLILFDSSQGDWI